MTVEECMIFVFIIIIIIIIVAPSNMRPYIVMAVITLYIANAFIN